MKRVICIDDNWSQSYGAPNYPVKGKIYNVVDSIPCSCGCSMVGLKLAEIPKWYWDANNFRDLDDKIQLSELTIEELLGEPAYA